MSLLNLRLSLPDAATGCKQIKFSKLLPLVVEQGEFFNAPLLRFFLTLFLLRRNPPVR